MNQDFLKILARTADLYGKTITPEKASIYWDAVKHRTIEDIKTAINRHIQDADRGRFFPLPADISHQLPSELNAWLSPNEAWAACPKDESDSAAMCGEMGAALSIAQDLINDGDMIAARMAFIEHYSRLVEEAKQAGAKPEWYPSYGYDKETRYKADKEVVERKNLALPASKKIPLPSPPEHQSISLDDLTQKAQEKDPAPAKESLAGLKKILDRKVK